MLHPHILVTAWLPDGSLALTYLPTRRTLTVDLSRFKGKVTAKWFDPTSGTYTAAAGAPLANAGSRPFMKSRSALRSSSVTPAASASV